MEERCGYVAIIGRPNVGKSTLLNYLLGQKLSITSRKPQTTRHRLLGIKTIGNTQIIYVDTPGLHQHQHNAMNRYLNQAATRSISGVNVIVWLIEAGRWTLDDDYVLSTYVQSKINNPKSKVPVILGVNKVDKISNKATLLPYLQEMALKHKFVEVIPISARQGNNLVELEEKVISLLPQSIKLFPEDQFTDRSERFLCAEIIREKLIRRLGAELPYKITVQIEYFESKKNLTKISALIWVERQGQKIIVIGKKGQGLKATGEAARKEMEEMLSCKVFLQLWVKIKQGWCDDERTLQQLGYFE
ncbi:GTPase Era [Candidatus Parabeggiatoa sp. HSG14]|uniref:GTPase Era n=1 Tax=Candidatus Parabeggiatoa sp. HSG14 TaxID=3055593 RepID=UPI0025A81D19|nr:GTPase Era [Thiotrichales bacterium HSG14]